MKRQLDYVSMMEQYRDGKSLREIGNNFGCCFQLVAYTLKKYFPDLYKKSAQENIIGVCFVCEKPVSSPRHGKMKLTCSKKCQILKRFPDKDSYRKHLREIRKRYYKNSPKFRLFAAKSNKKHRANNLQKTRARNLLSISVFRGKVIKPKECSKCGRTDLRIEAHHHDYSRPLDVTWLCSSCHADTHIALKQAVHTEDA